MINTMVSKAQLAICLSRFLGFISPKIRGEQYATDSDAAANILWTAKMQGDIEGKIVADLGCGTGILGIGALILGAKKVFFVDSDAEAIDVCRKNINSIAEQFGDESILSDKFEILIQDIDGLDRKADTVIQNPPFGTREMHADRQFLMKAFSIADTIYTLHKRTSDAFIRKIAGDNGFFVKGFLPIDLPLKNTYKFHTKKIVRIDVGCWCLKRM